MSQAKLVLSLPQGIITATSLAVNDFARHRSPGSGKYFDGRSLLVDLAVEDGKPAFQFLDEGGWRDANGDATAALAAASAGKRTKTALSNNAFSATPISAWRDVYLAKTGGEVLHMNASTEIAAFKEAECHDGMKPDDIAKAIGQAVPGKRSPHLYMIYCPIEVLVLSNLTPAEYVWYATHRTGKRFRAVAFTEVHVDPGLRLTATAVLDEARRDLAEHTTKKTKTIVFGDVFNRIPFTAWVGYDHEAQGGIYVGDAKTARLWTFPEKIPRAWERAY